MIIKKTTALRSSFLLLSWDYLRVTVAPAASSFSLMSLASSSLTSSLTADGALSTRSLASFRPRPVMSLTALMTLTFAEPAEVSSTVKLSLAAASPPAAPATATGAAAETSNSSSIALTRSLRSEIDAYFREAIIASLSKAMFIFLQYFGLCA